MAEKSVAQKLLIKPKASVWLSAKAKAPLLEPLPEGAKHVSRLEHATAAILFAEDEGALRKLLAKVGAERLAGPEVLWIAYPKGNRSDINRDSVWPIVGELGMRPIGQVAVDEVWSALRFRPADKVKKR